MNDIKIAKANLIAMLEEFVDQPLSTKGFKRRKGSTIYKRKLTDSIQEVDFVADFFPKCELGAEAHIHPVFIWKIPSVTDEAVRLVGGNKMLLANAPDIILKQPIEICAPKDSHTRWFAKSSEDYMLLGNSICSFIEEWLYDLLESLQNADDLIKSYEVSDERLLKQQHWYIFVSAAYSLKDEIDKAKSVMVAHLGNPGLRKRYSSVYERL